MAVNEEHDPYEGMSDNEIVIAETQNEHRLAQQDLANNGRIPWETDTTIGRYFRFTDCSDEMTADVVIVDRLTGNEVMRYDGADPANTNSYYGATGDGDAMARRGLTIGEVLVKSENPEYLTGDQIMRKYPQWVDYSYDYEDDVEDIDDDGDW